MIDFAIIIPCFNAADTIVETLDSVLNQSYSNWECIILDDCSSDNSCSIIANFIQQDPRFKLFTYYKSLGPSFLRNEGINKSQKKYIIFLDSDDLLDKNCLQNRSNFISQNLNHNMWIFYMQTFGQQSNIVNDHNPDSTEKELLSRFISKKYPWAITCVTWSKKFLTIIGGFNPELRRFTDPYIHIKALLHPDASCKIYPIRNPDCFYRIWNKSQSVSNVVKNDTSNAFSVFNIWLLSTLLNSNKLVEFKSETINNFRQNISWIYNHSYPKLEIHNLYRIYDQYGLLSIKEKASIKLLIVFYSLNNKYLSTRLIYYYNKFFYKFM